MRHQLLVYVSAGALMVGGIYACASEDTPSEPVSTLAPTCPVDPQPTSGDIAPTPNANDAGETVNLGPGTCRDASAETPLLQNQ